MRCKFMTMAAFVLLGTAACSREQVEKEVETLTEPTPTATQSPAVAASAPLVAPLANNQGAQIGSVTLTPAPTGVLIRVNVQAGGLAPGWHGLHLHQIGDCSDAAGGYQLSGGHVGKGHEGKLHGLLNPQGPEFGDLPNLYMPATGEGGGEFFTAAAVLSNVADAARAPLLDADGTALIIHAQPDDHQTQPIGGAGDRVACAVVK